MPFVKEHRFLAGIGRVLLDVGWILVAYLTAVAITRRSVETLSTGAVGHLVYLVAFVLVWCSAAAEQGLYTSRRSETLTSVLFSMTRAFFTSLLFSGFLIAIFIRGGVDRAFFLTFGVCALGAVLVFTLILRPSVWSLRRRGYNFRRILIVGANKRTANLVRVLLANEQYGYHIVGFLEDEEPRRALLRSYDIPCLGNIRDLERLLVEQVIDGVYIALPVRSAYQTIQDIAHLCEGVGVPVRLLADLFPLRMAMSDVTHLGDISLLSLTSEPEIQTRFALKRAFDLLGALVLSVALAPVFLVIALLIKLDSRGPVFSFRERLGQDLRPFKMMTFRVAPLGRNAEDGLTRVGAYLRRYGLNELPEIVNVLLGQMSLGGLRPLAPETSEEAESLNESGKAARPGETGPAAFGPSVDAQSPPSRKRTMVSLVGLAVIDACCITAAYAAAVVFVAPSRSVLPLSAVNNLPYLVVFVLVWFSAAIDRRLWSTRTIEGLAPDLSVVTKAVADAAMFGVFFMVLFTPEGLPRRFLVAFCFATLAALLVCRVAVRLLLLALHRLGRDLRRAVIVGANERTAHLVEVLKSRETCGYAIEGILDDDPERTQSFERMGLASLGPTSALEDELSKRNVDEVFVTLPVRTYYETIRHIASNCERVGVPVHLLADLFPVEIATSRVMHVEDIPLLSLSPISEAHLKLAIKRFMDFMGSTVLILALSPVLATIALLIKLDSSGPVLFGQVRVGQNQRRFKILKFRSMLANAEELRQALEQFNEADGPVFKIRNDPRITRVGRFIRKFSLDEFPQLFNVWWGEMSLVGPRPPIPSEVEQYTWSQRRRLSVKPGMTGLWQVSGRSDVDFNTWVEMDLTYIDSWSLWQDFLILLKTFKAVVSGRGAA